MMMEYLTIMMSNSFDGQLIMQGDKLLSTKRNGEEGVGLQSVGAVVSRYDGVLKTQHEAGVFTVSMTLRAKL